MNFPADFPITEKWPARDPGVLQLYSFPTPNGIKIPIMLEEIGLPYEAHRVTLAQSDVKSPAFLSLNPNGKIPAIIDPNGPDGKPLALFESGAILLYLAEKTGKLLGQTTRDRHIITQWLMFQMAGIGPMFGQMGHFFGKDAVKAENSYARTRFADETRRLLTVLEAQLEDREWIARDYSIADIAIGSWVRQIERYGEDAELAVDWLDFENVHDYLDRFLERPAVQRGVNIPTREG
ncbi:MAG: glutathione S-transferase N-terminal domain-containing protein [Paracoccaceae bacterium]|nr:glutathione S-transferase N-terminal domain-containing protein [Paracoccaceae bacterium]MDP7186449.1 glutathione S-transferase N-terminal domain-containing protein [Paracoccaceae bacterium]